MAERAVCSIRMALRRFTRLTNAYSKKLDNLKFACALYFAYYGKELIARAVRRMSSRKNAASSNLIVRRFQQDCWKASCSGTRRARISG
jgi:hypothetical protein